MKAWVALLGLAAVTTFQDAHDEAAVKKALPDAAGIARTEVALTPGLVAKIEKALGEKPPSKAVLHSATIELAWHKPGKYSARATVFSVKDVDATHRFAVAIVPDENLIAAVIPLEDREDLSGFLEQFVGTFYSENSLFRPASDLEELKKQAGEAKSDDAKKNRALLAVLRAMKEIQAAAGRLGPALRGGDKDSAAPAARALVEQLGRVQTAAAEATFLQDKHRATMASIAGRAKDTASEIARLANEGAFADAARRLSQMNGASCGGCHGSFQRRFVEARDQAGLGAGYFAEGFDFARTPKPEPALQDRIALALRRAIMILESAK
jgi:hypothetical protein